MIRTHCKKPWKARLLAGVAVMAMSCSMTFAAGTPGVTSSTIKLGAFLPLTGVFAAGGKAQLAGINLYWHKVNANGGVCDGRSVKVIARDHAYDVQKTVTAYSDIHNQILAVQGVTGTPMSKALAPRMAADNVVSITLGWSPALIGSGMAIPGSTYDVDMVNAVDYLVKTGALKKGDTIGYVYFPGDYGGAGLKGAQFAADHNGITVKPFQVTPSVSDLSAQINKMVADDVDAMFLSVSPPLLANAAAVSHTKGLDVPIVVPSPNFVPALMDSSSADQIAGRVLVASGSNAWAADTPGIEKLRALYKKSDQDVPPQQSVLVGYASARIMDAALQKACAAGNLTRKTFEKAFSGIKSFDLNGLAVNVSYQDASVPPAIKTYIVAAKKDVSGGLAPIMDQPFKGKNIEAYVQSEYGQD